MKDTLNVSVYRIFSTTQAAKNYLFNNNTSHLSQFDLGNSYQKKNHRKPPLSVPNTGAVQETCLFIFIKGG